MAWNPPTIGLVNWGDEVIDSLNYLKDREDSSPGVNYLINGSFDVWQRATGVAGVAGAYAYHADRWGLFTGTGAASSVNRLTWPIGTYGDGFESYAQWGRTTAGTTNSTMSNRIEDVRTLAGKTVTISWNMNTASGSVDLYAGVTQNFGTGGSASVVTNPVNVQTATTSSGATRFSQTLTIPSVLSKTVGSAVTTGLADHYLQVDLVRAFASTNGATGTVNVWDVKLEIGAYATPYVKVPLGTTLAACNRYVYGTYNFPSTTYTYATGMAISTTQALVTLTLPAPMRGTPDIIAAFAGGGTTAFGSWALTSTTNALIALSATFTVGSLNYQSATNTVEFLCTVASGLVAGSATRLVSNGGQTNLLVTRDL